ncbi:MAG: NADH-quinone oxidoreductase subunit C [Deltaproteobacteria bacterium]|nr:NADH-quinone oxidoreductase subunit C [Deltaproteobacteria bacterium]
MPTAGQKKLLVELKNSLAQAVPEGQVSAGDYTKTGYHLEVRLDQGGMRRVAKAMLEKRFYLETLTAVDFIDHFELVYFYSTYYQDLFRVMIRIRTSKEVSPFSISSVYPEAIWLEREVYDFFGIRFQEHPDLKRIINPDEADYFPLLKNFGKTKFTTDIDDILC